MNAKPQFRPQLVEALNILWRTLPVRSNDQFGTLEDFCFALQDFSDEAIWATVNNLRRGLIEDASKDFCPRAPKLAEYVRSEQARLNALNRPKALPPAPIHKEFQRHNERQRRETKELERQGYRKLADNIGQEEMNTLAKRRKFPAGSKWFWALDEVWGKPQEAGE